MCDLANQFLRLLGASSPFFVVQELQFFLSPFQAFHKCTKRLPLLLYPLSVKTGMNLGLLLGLPRLILISDLGQIPLIFQVLLTNMILTDLKRHVVFMMHLGYINQIFFNKMHFLLWWFLIKSNFLYHNNGSMQIWWAKSVSMCRFIHRFEMFYFLILGFAKQILNFLVKKNYSILEFFS